MGRSGPPEGRRQQHQEGKDLQAAQEHGHDAGPFGGGIDASVSRGNIPQSRPQVIQRGRYRGERGKRVEPDCLQNEQYHDEDGHIDCEEAPNGINHAC